MKTLILIVATIAAVASDCDDEWVSFGGNCFKFDNTGRTYADAETFCDGLGAHLVSIHSDAENTFVIDTARGLELGSTWIGLDDNADENQFSYLDGTEFYRGGYTNGEPNNWGGNQDCSYFPFRHTYGWDDMGCTNNAATLCEMNQPCISGWTEIGDSCYKWESESRNYASAKARCTEIAGYLASITSPEENTQVIDMVRDQSGQDSPPRTWIGLDDEAQEGFWHIVDPGNTDFLGRFARGEPNNARGNQNCIWFPYGGTYYWDDISCTATRSAVCKKADPSAIAADAREKVQGVLGELYSNCITSGAEEAADGASVDLCEKLRSVFDLLVNECSGNTSDDN